MDSIEKQNNTFILNIFQVIVSFIAFIIITYILFHIDNSKESLIYLTLDIIIIGLVINGIKSFMNDLKTSL